MDNKPRTPKQNKSLHKYFRLLEGRLKGISQRQLYSMLDMELAIPWTVTSTKAMLDIIANELHDKQFSRCTAYEKRDCITVIMDRIAPGFTPFYDWKNKNLIAHFCHELNLHGFTKSVCLENQNLNHFPVDECFLKDIFKAMLPDICRKHHTADLTTVELQEAYIAFDLAISIATGVHVEWPCDEPPLLGEYACT